MKEIIVRRRSLGIQSLSTATSSLPSLISTRRWRYRHSTYCVLVALPFRKYINLHTLSIATAAGATASASAATLPSIFTAQAATLPYDRMNSRIRLTHVTRYRSRSNRWRHTPNARVSYIAEIRRTAEVAPCLRCRQAWRSFVV